ncbi:PREDICTED: uncharacterized protein LOC109158496 [Ipomoea nil]|uniref:uncharacterized protein LOC109158496 n=1 Tax=Ipomoea nil TaxID=35883 RepID=UPI00090130E5|nr:PREDICTED: uncharacterized protein LOC109158496 [Ipomoea nil]
MVAYVDDILVKSREEINHVGDLADCFQVMLKYNLRLNPKNCAFAVQGGKFLGYMVTKRGIELNPEKVQAIMDMQPPNTVKDLQRLTGRLAALSCFLSKSADKTVPFFEVMKRKEGFVWTAECQQSFEELKKYLSTPPVLSTPQVGEPLFLYLATSLRAVSSVLIREEERTQHPVYYVSRSLKSAEMRYTPLEKIVYALVITVREDDKDAILEDGPGEWWEMHVDGATSRQHCGGGVMLITLEGFRLYYALSYLFQTSNNEGEYEAVLGGLRLTKTLGVGCLRIKTDSRLVVGQVSGTCEAKNARMAQYKEKTVELLKGFGAYEIEYISRADNTEADILSKIALEGVLDHLVRICQKDELGELPEDPGVAARVRRKAPSFEIIDGQLYKRSFGGPLLKCLLRSEPEKIMDEAHRGICAAHQGTHTLTRKLVVQGYYWPTMMRDCIEWIAKCGIC